MNLKRRRGFALIWVVLIGALIFVGIVGLSLRIVPQNMITTARTNSQRALAVAEEGNNQVLFDLRNFTNNDFVPDSTTPLATSIHYLTTNDIMSLINASSGAIIIPSDPSYVHLGTTYPPGTFITNPSPPSGDSFETSYLSKIKVISNDTTNKILNVYLYTLGTVENRANSNVLARKAIETSFVINYKVVPTSTPGEWVPGKASPVGDYALFSGADINFKGGAQTVSGDIHAVGTIDLGTSKSQVRVGGGGNAEAEVNIQGNGIVTGKPITPPDVTKITFPVLNIDNYSQLADSFRAGLPPYDGIPIKDEEGNTLVFANTSDPVVRQIIQSYLGAPGTSSPIDGINNFYNDLKNGTGALAPHPGGLTATELTNLQTYMGSIVYYVKGPASINANFACAGTLVIDGNLSINGNATVGDPSNPGGSAILVKGDITKSNGTANLYGLFYSTGSVNLGNGTFYCEGSIISDGSMNLVGNYNVKYVPLTWNPNIGIGAGYYTPDIPGETYYSINSAADGTTSYSWKEISYEAFQTGN